MLDLKAIFELEDDSLVEVAAETPNNPSKPATSNEERVGDRGQMLAKGVQPNSRLPLSKPESDWPADAADFALLLTPDDLPVTPFEFGGAYCVVTDQRKFLAWLQADIRRGPAGPRAICGAIQGDLRRLQEMLKETA